MREPTGAVPPRPDGVAVRVEGVYKRFRARGTAIHALANVSLDIERGSFVSLIGPSGCGKSTLLRIIAGLERPTGGRVTVRQTDPRRPENSMVFQQESIFPWMTVRENVGYGLAMRRVARPERDRTTDHFVRTVGLERFATVYPYQLSGGMKQRVSVARAFANNPEVLLMDEPFGSVDEQTRLLLQEELQRIWVESGNTVVFVTHSIDEAIVLSDRLVVMSRRPGRVKADLPVGLPRPRKVERLRGSAAFGELFTRVWTELREEVLAGQEEATDVSTS